MEYKCKYMCILYYIATLLYSLYSLSHKKGHNSVQMQSITLRTGHDLGHIKKKRQAKVQVNIMKTVGDISVLSIFEPL